jgi:hypothetical protein
MRDYLVQLTVEVMIRADDEVTTDDLENDIHVNLNSHGLKLKDPTVTEVKILESFEIE